MSDQRCSSECVSSLFVLLLRRTTYHLVAFIWIITGGIEGRDTPFPMTSKAPRQTTIFLRRSRDIQIVKSHGRRLSTTFFNLLACKMNDTPTRVGIIVGRRFGNAVRRNRAKRVFRDLARQLYPDLVPGRGLLVFPKRDALLQSREDLTTTWMSSLARMHLLRHGIKGTD